MPKRKFDKKLAVKYRATPKHKWRIIESLGRMHGGLNAGIYKVSAREKAPGMVLIQKRFGHVEFREKVAYREIQILHQVSDHPNITKMVDHFFDEPRLTGAVYLEYCDRGSLADVTDQIVRGKRINEHKIWNWFIQLTEALVYCHFGPYPEMSATELLQSGWNKVYHRDIKPGNILITTEGNQIVAKLADFGCATTEDLIALDPDRDHAVTASKCTPGFDAPEYPFFGVASDIWQLAISMMCLCTGICSPFSAMNPTGQPWNMMRPAGPEYSKELSWAMKECLEEDCRKRPTTLSVSKYLNKQYGQLMARSAPDNFPMEVFEPKNERIPQAPQYGPMQARGPMEYALDFAQFPPGFAQPVGQFPVDPMDMALYQNPGRHPRRKGFRY